MNLYYINIDTIDKRTRVFQLKRIVFLREKSYKFLIKLKHHNFQCKDALLAFSLEGVYSFNVKTILTLTFMVSTRDQIALSQIRKKRYVGQA